MGITGPFLISIVTDDNGAGHEMHLDFTDEFRQLDSTERTEEFNRYVDVLREEVSRREDDTRERQGMFTVLQIAEQLAPHVAADEIVLNETIIVEIEPGNPLQGLFPGDDTRH
jgi:hypothetical protein